MYYLDLSPFQYQSRPLEIGPTLNVGWLCPEHEFQTGKPDPRFLDALWAYCLQPIVEHRGYHICEFCALAPDASRHTSRQGRTNKLGSKLICVFDSESTAYLSPDLIFHYVLEHNYAPPDDYVRAVVSGPRPGTEEYAKLVRPYLDNATVEASAKEAARAAAARYGFFLDSNDRAQPIPDEAFEDYSELSIEELALELRLKSY